MDDATMARRFFIVLAVLAFVFGGSYAVSYASALIVRFIGPWTAFAIESNGGPTRMVFDPNLPRPDWVPVYPGAMVVQASRVTSDKIRSGFHSLDLTTRASFEDVKRFYVESLTASGFVVVDDGIGSLNPLTAAFLGLAGSLSGRRATTDDQINIVIQTPEGLIGPRPLQLQWRKISETAIPAESPSQ
jgi:hypothetical protein